LPSAREKKKALKRERKIFREGKLNSISSRHQISLNNLIKSENATQQWKAFLVNTSLGSNFPEKRGK
jgi:hypothetical protein